MFRRTAHLSIVNSNVVCYLFC